MTMRPSVHPTPFGRHTRSPLAFAMVAVSLPALSIGTAGALRAATNLRATWPPEADTYYLPSSRTLRFLSLGHSELASDLVAARANVYFGTQMVTRGAHRWMAGYVNTAIDLDPYFARPYLSGSAMLVYNGRDINAPAVEAATAILRRGVKAFPLDWQLHFHLGFNLLFELPQLARNDRRVPDWRQEGAEAMQRAALFEDAPSWLPTLAARMLTKRGKDELAVRHLEQAYTVASEEARKLIRYKLEQLRAGQRAQMLEDERRRWNDMIADRYPYAPDAFSVVAGPRHPRFVDLGTAGPTGAGKPEGER